MEAYGIFLDGYVLQLESVTLNDYYTALRARFRPRTNEKDPVSKLGYYKLWVVFSKTKEAENKGTIHSALCSCKGGSLDSNATAADINRFKLKRLSFAQKLLSDIHDCHFDKYINLISNIHFIKGGHVWSQVGACYKRSANKTKEHKARCIKQRIPEACKNSIHRVTKVLRMTVDNLEYLLKTRENMKIIHLFRDPRAIINSRIKTNWYPSKDIISNAEGLCHKMLYDFVEGQKLYSRYPERFRFIYYEDLNDRPLDKVKTLYKYLGMSLDENKYSIVESIRVFNSNKTQAEKERETNTAYWWRKSIDWSLLRQIDEKCAGVYKALGYKKFDTYADLSNLSITSVVIPEQYKI